MSEDKIILPIDVESSEAIKNLSKFEKDASTSLGKVEAGFGALKTVAAAALAFFAGREVIQFFDASIDAAIGKQDALNGLRQALELTGGASDEAMEGFKDFADTLEKTTKYEDDAVLSAIALAKSMGLTDDAAKKVVTGATELGAVLGGDLESNVAKLAKAHTGNTTALEKQIPQLKNLSKEQKLAGESTDFVLSRFGGSALAQLNTFSGAVGQLSKGWGNFQEVLGTAIIENPTVIATIQELTKSVNELEQGTKDNRSTLDEFISGGMKGLAVAVSVGTEVLEAFIIAGQGLIAVFNAIKIAILELCDKGFGLFAWVLDHSAGLWIDFVGDVTNGLANMSDALVAWIKDIPLIGDALTKLGGYVDDAGIPSVGDMLRSVSGAASDLGEDLDIMARKTGKALGDTKDAARSSASATFDSFDEFNKGFNGFQSKIDAAAQAIFDADHKVIGSSKKAGDQRKDNAKGAGKDAEEVAKLTEELAKFETGLATHGADEFEKLDVWRGEQLKLLAKFAKEMPDKEAHIESLRLEVRRQHWEKTEELLAASDKRIHENSVKSINETRAAVQSAASDPLTFVVSKLEIDPQAQGDLAAGMGAAVGVLGKMLEGAAGAKSLISAGAGAFADAFIPGIGGAVGGVVAKLAEGPEATKQFIREFVEAVPDIMIAVSESMPVVVEAFVDAMVNEGGAERMAIAFAKAMMGEAWFKAAGKAMGIEVGSAFNSSNIAQTFSKAGTSIDNAADKGAAKFKAAIPEMQKGIQNGFKAAQQLPFHIVKGFQDGVATFRNAIPEMKTAIAEGFRWIVGIIPAMAQGATHFALTAPKAIEKGAAAFASKAYEAILNGGVAFFKAFDHATNALASGISEAFKGVIGALVGAFEGIGGALVGVFEGLFGGLYAALGGVFSGAVTGITDAVTNLFSGIWQVVDFIKNDVLAGFLNAVPTLLNGIKDALGIKWPDLPAFNWPTMPSWSWPDIPHWLKTFTWPEIKLPELNMGGGGGGGGSAWYDPTGYFAEGGVVPRGYLNDSYPALLTSDERVLTPSQNHSFERLVSLLESGGGGAPGASPGQPLAITLQVGEQQLSKVLINLNRQGFRTA